MKSLIKNRRLPKNSTKRVGAQTPKYIIFHEASLGDGRSPAEYNLRHYEQKLLNDTTTIGYHYMVSDTEIFQFLEDDVATDHCGNPHINGRSIGVERLICKGIDYAAALDNQAQLIAYLAVKHDIALDHILPHSAVALNGKPCPQRLINGWYYADDEETQKAPYSIGDFYAAIKKYIELFKIAA